MAEHEVVCLPSASVIAVLRRDFANRPIASMAVAVLADPVFETEDPRVENHKQPRLRPARTLHGDPGGSDVSSNSLQQSNLARSATDLGLKGSGSHWPRLLFTRREAKGILALSPPGEGMEAMDLKPTVPLRPVGISELSDDPFRDERIVGQRASGVFRPSSFPCEREGDRKMVSCS